MSQYVFNNQYKIIMIKLNLELNSSERARKINL